MTKFKLYKQKLLNHFKNAFLRIIHTHQAIYRYLIISVSKCELCRIGKSNTNPYFLLSKQKKRRDNSKNHKNMFFEKFFPHKVDAILVVP